MDKEKVIKAWEIFRDSNPYEICSGREFRAIREPEYCMGQMIEDTIALLKEQQERIERLQPKNGKWLEYAGDQMCSVCGSSYSDLFPEYDRTPFCPHCGAKMEGGDVE